MLSELKWDTARWPDLTPLVEYALNTTKVLTLGVSPIECHSGIKPRETLRFMAVHGARLKSVDKRAPKVDLVKKHLEKIRRVFKEMHDYVKRKKVLSRERNWRSQKRTAEPNIHVGDFVMSACIRKNSKLDLAWIGPFEVTKAKSKFIFEIRRPGATKTQDAHIRRLKRYCGAENGTHAALVSDAVSKEGEWKVAKILSWRHKQNSATVELEVMWAGFPGKEWATHEKLENLTSEPDARGIVRKFLKRELAKKSVPILQEKLDQLEAGGPAEASGPTGPLKPKVMRTSQSAKQKEAQG